MAVDIIAIADSVSPDHNRDRLRVDARKWYLAHMHPEQWEHRQRLEHTGKMGIAHAADGTTRRDS